ncbi:hypothetical protein OG909_03315 [Streptomyces sp. NBC_01754]|uniref:hypothetical protein n=1 Tax=Streptomyces sp. NBC_01754 TaxID=2975930 RepID=UPI002DDA6BA7|nr:hypothetical protein [Streptomyces sp. NBC_01754]WSC91404.1 hypothetical protein OG909_03315 [Streptomyces sp. NBC_01754]
MGDVTRRYNRAGRPRPRAAGTAARDAFDASASAFSQSGAAGLNAGNAVVTAGSARTQYANGLWLRAQGIHHIGGVCGNQPGMLKWLRELP